MSTFFIHSPSTTTSKLVNVGHAANMPRHWRKLVLILLAGLFCAALADGAFARDDKTRNTLIGAGLGAAGGALLSHGDVWGTLGGAAAGGLIGNVITNDHRDRGRYDRGRYDRRNGNGRGDGRRDGRRDDYRHW